MQAANINSKLVKFHVAAVLFFLWGVIQGALQSQLPIHNFISQGPAGIIIGAHVHVNLLGWVSLSVISLTYYLVPILTGKPLAKPGLVNWVFWIFVPVLTAEMVLMILAGIAGGNAFAAGTVGPALDAIMGPYMMPIGILSIICALVFITFVAQILATVNKK